MATRNHKAGAQNCTAGLHLSGQSDPHSRGADSEPLSPDLLHCGTADQRVAFAYGAEAVGTKRSPSKARPSSETTERGLVDSNGPQFFTRRDAPLAIRNRARARTIAVRALFLLNRNVSRLSEQTSERHHLRSAATVTAHGPELRMSAIPNRDQSATSHITRHVSNQRNTENDKRDLPSQCNDVGCQPSVVL